MFDPKDKKPINLPENVQVDYNFERMLKGFLKQVQKEGTMQEVRDRRYYLKPSAKKRAERNKRRK